MELQPLSDKEVNLFPGICNIPTWSAQVLSPRLLGHREACALTTQLVREALVSEDTLCWPGRTIDFCPEHEAHALYPGSRYLSVFTSRNFMNLSKTAEATVQCELEPGLGYLKVLWRSPKVLVVRSAGQDSTSCHLPFGCSDWERGVPQIWVWRTLLYLHALSSYLTPGMGNFFYQGPFGYL